MVKQVHHGSNFGIWLHCDQNEYHFYNSPKGPDHWAEFKGRLYFQPEIHCGV